MPSYAVRYDSRNEKLFSYLDIDHARQNSSYVDVPENKSIIKKRASFPTEDIPWPSSSMIMRES
jgi:hypothetical protein